MQNIKFKVLICFLCCTLVLLINVDFLISEGVDFSTMPTYKIIC
jgi:hypothetical protein